MNNGEHFKIMAIYFGISRKRFFVVAVHIVLWNLKYPRSIFYDNRVKAVSLHYVYLQRLCNWYPPQSNVRKQSW